MDLTAELLDFARDLLQRQRVQALLLNADVFRERVQELEDFLRSAAGPVHPLVSDPMLAQHLCSSSTLIALPDLRLTRTGQMRMAVVIGLAKGYLQPGVRLICLTGIPERGCLDTLFSLDVGSEFEAFTSDWLQSVPGIRPEVFARVLEIAVSLGFQGREGRPVGATFVLGDTEAVLRFCQPLVLNPFHCHPPVQRNVPNPLLIESIKEFSTIDGAFIIQGDGVVEAAGVYLHPPAAAGRLPWGLGTRHYSAAGITAASAALAITISSSTGIVTIFQGGGIVLEIDREGLLAPRGTGHEPP
jgi:DNA integrity scanning protein DisA with diadenylate cyclase activity